MEYKGYIYFNEYEVESDGDNAKYYHDVKRPDGKVVTFDWSPYNIPTFEDFSAWIDLGMPKRITTGPLNREDLIKLSKERHE